MAPQLNFNFIILVIAHYSRTLSILESTFILNNLPYFFILWNHLNFAICVIEVVLKISIYNVKRIYELDFSIPVKIEWLSLVLRMFFFLIRAHFLLENIHLHIEKPIFLHSFQILAVLYLTYLNTIVILNKLSFNESSILLIYFVILYFINIMLTF